MRPIIRFSQIEAPSGVLLLAAAIAAVIWTNSPWSETYFSVLEQHMVIELEGFHLEESVLHLISDGLMAIFFFVVGLEIKRELALARNLARPMVRSLAQEAASGMLLLLATAAALIWVVVGVGLASMLLGGYRALRQTDSSCGWRWQRCPNSAQ